MSQVTTDDIDVRAATSKDRGAARGVARMGPGQERLRTALGGARYPQPIPGRARALCCVLLRPPHRPPLCVRV